MPPNSHQPEEPQWLAKPSGDCCLKGHLHTGTVQGTFERLVDIETYVTHPPADKANGHIVLYYPDVFGFFTNGLLVMDSFAAAGYLAIGIDYFQGVSIDGRAGDSG
jgi:dienelactone hydrolase